jgi:hypothetical protein
MSSKLLHAIVGAGIALGSSGACMSSPTGLEDPSPDAFCDTSWPTTKGGEVHTFPACLDPTGECRAQGPEVACIRTFGSFSCEGAIVAATCVDAAWTCPDDWQLVDDCPCFGTAPPGYVCTEDGVIKLDTGGAGAGGSPNDPDANPGGGGEYAGAGAGG